MTVRLVWVKISNYRKIQLICPGRVHGQRTNLMGLYSGVPICGVWGGDGLIFERKNTLIFNLLSLLHFFLFFCIKLVLWHISRRTRSETSSKLTITRMRKLNFNVNFFVKFEHIPLLVTIFLLLTLISQVPAGVVAFCSNALCLLESIYVKFSLMKKLGK